MLIAALFLMSPRIAAAPTRENGIPMEHHRQPGSPGPVDIFTAKGERPCAVIRGFLRRTMGNPISADLNGDHGMYLWLDRQRHQYFEYRDLWNREGTTGSHYSCWVTRTYSQPH